jgi:NadR type nicotinamide-nucleotide adenylyltransferase
MEKRGIIRIGVIGAESTGKTWLCEALAEHYATVWVAEYAGEFFNDSDIYNYTLEDLEIIARKQLDLEQEAMKKANTLLFCDTTLITLRIWAELEFQVTPPFIAGQLSEIPYDHYFITNNEIAWHADPLRQNKHSRELLFAMNEAEVQKSGIPYTVISGKEQERLAMAIQVTDTLVVNRN